jgi:hypothetical protein
MDAARVFACYALTVLVTGATAAFADPITSWYQVTVQQRQDLQTAQMELISPIQFTMSMTFDDQMKSSFAGFGYAGAFFGAPIFEGVPRALVSPGLRNGIDVNSTTYTYRQGQPYLPDYYETNVWQQVSHGARNSGVQINRYGFQPVGTVDWSPGALDASALLSILNWPSMNFYAWSHARNSSGEYLGNSYMWHGTATRLEAPPVPEPTTLSLVVIGLAAAAAQRRMFRR